MDVPIVHAELPRIAEQRNAADAYASQIARPLGAREGEPVSVKSCVEVKRGRSNLMKS